MTNQPRLIDELNALHSTYVGALNTALDAGELAFATELAAEYDREAILLMAEREGRQDLLGHFGLDRDGSQLPIARVTPIRRFMQNLRAA
ncbi:MAG: hypothetical protein ABIR39_14170 [Nocardioides sp.]|uniref:hypothetical protein n=1 Tax=Nocardioides sp. TaxID=35761 RepID=UPI0032660A9C